MKMFYKNVMFHGKKRAKMPTYGEFWNILLNFIHTRYSYLVKNFHTIYCIWTLDKPFLLCYNERVLHLEG